MNSSKVNLCIKVVFTLIIIVVILNWFSSHVIGFEDKLLDLKYKNQVQKLNNAIDSLPVAENVSNFFATSMYVPTYPKSYNFNSRKFLKDYIGIVKDCGDSNGSCFASEYRKLDGKEIYFPKYEGACAVLKIGMTMCLLPQIGDRGITGIIDLNGEQKPNILGKDLRLYSRKPFEKKIYNTSVEAEQETILPEKINTGKDTESSD